jgi:hypothetical protein
MVPEVPVRTTNLGEPENLLNLLNLVNLVNLFFH